MPKHAQKMTRNHNLKWLQRLIQKPNRNPTRKKRLTCPLLANLLLIMEFWRGTHGSGDYPKYPGIILLDPGIILLDPRIILLDPGIIMWILNYPVDSKI
jgi:hypothetical protein